MTASIKTLALSITAIAVWMSPSVTSAAVITNIAPLGTAANNGYWNVWGDPTAWVNDGAWAWNNTNGFHGPNSPTEQEKIWVTWTEDYSVDEVELWHCEAGAQYVAAGYLIQTLNNGGTASNDGDWTTQVTVTTNTNVNPSYAFGATTTRGVRLVFTDIGASTPLRFEEILVNGTAIPEPSSIGLTTLAGLLLLRRKR